MLLSSSFEAPVIRIWELPETRPGCAKCLFGIPGIQIRGLAVQFPPTQETFVTKPVCTNSQTSKPTSSAEGNEVLRMWADKIQRSYDDIITVQIPLPKLQNAQMRPRERSAAEYRLYAIMPKVHFLQPDLPRKKWMLS